MKLAFAGFSRKEKALLSLTVGLLMVFLLYNFVALPLVQRFDALNQKILADKIKLNKSLKILKQKDKVEAEYAQYSQLLKQKASDEQEMATLLSEIEAVARQLAIRISDMKPRPTKAVDFYKRLSVDVEVEAPLSEITKFIYNLQDKPHLFSVEKLRLEGKSYRGNAILKGYLQVSKDLIQ